MRNKYNYDEAVLQNEYLNTGVEQESLFNSIPSFHVTLNFSVDFMHDVLEGIIKYGIANALKYFIDNGFFKLNDFNHRMTHFDYGEIESRNKCEIIKAVHLKNKNIHTSARESYTLLNFFTCFVGDFLAQNKEDKV